MNNNNGNNLSEQNRTEQNLRSLIIFTFILACVIFFLGLCAAYLGLKFYRKIQSQETVLSQFRASINRLSIRLDEVNPDLDEEAKNFIESCDSFHYNIIFVGNSITRHGIVDYWWSDKRGMAASSISKDYVHIVEDYIDSEISRIKQSASSGLNAYAYNYSAWETLSHDRAQTYPLLDKYLKNGTAIDCVVLQLGENVYDAHNENSSYQTDYELLIRHIREKTSNAKIITVGNFWADSVKDRIKSEVARKENVSYVDLSQIQDNPEYESKIGNMVEGDDGISHKIEHLGVARHPGDKGMEWIASRISKEILK